MHRNRRGFVRLSGAAASLAALGLSSGRAGAQDGPPLEVVKIVTGFPPGGTSDTLCRRVADNLAPIPRARWSTTRRAPAARSPCSR